MLKKSKEASRHVESVLSALDIIDCFQDKAELTLNQIIEHTGMTRSRTMRMIGTLESRGYLVGNPETRSYYPGIKWPIIAKSFERLNHVEVLIRPVLGKLARETGESATYYIRHGLERIALAREEGSHSIRYVIHEGERHRLCRGGAPGKVLLGFGPDNWLDRVIEEEDFDPAPLLAQIEKTKMHGYGLSEGENTPGACSIAVPVYREDGLLAGALAISGPESRLSGERLTSMVEQVMEMAGFLSQRLGAPPMSPL